jgi:hypothetical protein
VETTSIGTVELKSEDGHVIDTGSEVHGGTFYYHCGGESACVVSCFAYLRNFDCKCRKKDLTACTYSTRRYIGT